MKRYDTYKDSGVQWIGEIPSHWDCCRIKDVLIKDKDGIKIGPFGSSLTGKVGADLPYKVYGQWNIIGADFDAGLNTIDEDPYKELGENYSVASGDILISMMGTIGKCATIPNNIMPGIMDSHVVKIRIDLGLYSTKFFEYLYDKDNSTIIFNELQKVKGGSIMDGLNSTVIKNLRIVVPPLAEQEAIAAWLDVKCGEIDKVIGAQQRRIELLQELRQSIITRAVTRGINPDASMKPSGIDWIGDVPAHWNNLRLRFVCELRNGYTPSKANPEFWTDGTIPWYRMEDIRESGRHLNKAKQYITQEAVKGGGLFEAGSFILATTATIGEHAVLIVDSQANQRFTNLKIRKSLTQSITTDYFFYYLFVIDEYCKTTTRTATFPAVNMEDLKNFYVVFPSVDEQKEIIKFIERETGKVDAAIARAEREIFLLQELRQSIITEVVTGKRKVC